VSFDLTSGIIYHICLLVEIGKANELPPSNRKVIKARKRTANRSLGNQNNCNQNIDVFLKSSPALVSALVTPWTGKEVDRILEELLLNIYRGFRR
jgi:hypothetical protein